MNDVILFLGSGTSYSSGLPSVIEITNEALSGSWHDHSDQNFYRGKHPAEYFEKDNIVYRLQSFLNIIKVISDQYYNDRGRSESNYEDLFYMCKQIVDNELWEIDNPLIVPFIDLINDKIKDLCEPFPNKPGFHIDLQLLAQRTCDYLECVVWHSIGHGIEPSGLGLISEIISSDLIDKT